MNARLVVMAAAALIALGGCATESTWSNPTWTQSADQKLPRPVDQKWVVPDDPVTPLSPGQIRQAELAEAAADAEHRARAECVYQAQMANVTTPGLLGGFLTGLGAGQTCINYYRSIGVIR